MIRVVVVLDSARTGRRTLLATADVWNDGGETRSSGGTRGAYVAELKGRGGRAWKRIRVEGFPRRRLLAADLLYRILRVAVGDRNP